MMNTQPDETEAIMATKKTTQRQRTTKKAETPAPMDPEVTPALSSSLPMAPRWCYILKTLKAEVESAFAGVEYHPGEADGRGVVHNLTLRAADGGENALLLTTLRLLDGHPALTGVDIDEVEGTVTVRVTPDPRTRDSRDPLGVVGALAIMAEEED